MALPRGQPPAPGRGEQDFDLPAEALSRVGAPPQSAAGHSKPMAVGILTEDARLVRVVQPVWPLTGLNPHDVHCLAIVIVWRHRPPRRRGAGGLEAAHGVSDGSMEPPGSPYLRRP